MCYSIAKLRSTHIFPRLCPNPARFLRVNVLDVSVANCSDFAMHAIDNIAELRKQGDVFKGTVKTVYEYGCLVELLRNQQGLLHVSNMSNTVPAPPARDVVKVGDSVDVRVVEVDRYERGKKLFFLFKVCIVRWSSCALQHVCSASCVKN